MVQCKLKQEFEKEIEKLTQVKNNKKLSIQQTARNLLIGFFVLMVLLTVLSRVADSLTIAKVETIKPKSGELVFRIKGEGTIEADSEKYISVLEGIKIEEVAVEEGQSVKQGDNLMVLSMEDIIEKLATVNNQIEKLKIQMEQEGLSDSDSELLKQEEATIKLENSKLDLETTIKNSDRAIEFIMLDIEKTNNDLKKASEDYDKAYVKLSEDILEKKTEEYTEAKNEYDNKKFEYDEAIRQAERDMQDAKRELNKVNNTENESRIDSAINRYNNAIESGNQSEINAAQNYLDNLLYGEAGIDEHKSTIEVAELKVKRANDDMKAAKEKWETYLVQNEEKMNKALDNLNKVKDGTYDYESELKAEQEVIEAAEELVSEYEKKLKDAEYDKLINTEKAQREIDKSLIDLEQAKKQDSNTQLNKINNKKNIELRKASIEVDIREKNEQAAKLIDLKNRNGIIASPVDGTITAIGASAGNKSTTENAVTISKDSEGYLIRGTITEKEAEYTAVGDEIVVTLKGQKRGNKTEVSSLNYKKGADTAEITAELPEGEYMMGASASIEINKKSEYYDRCIPIEALREDSNGTYVLVIRYKNSVLGEEATAFRLDVNVIDKDNKNAAIERLSSDDEIISNSNKNIEEGDRVRVGQ